MDQTEGQANQTPLLNIHTLILVKRRRSCAYCVDKRKVGRGIKIMGVCQMLMLQLHHLFAERKEVFSGADVPTDEQRGHKALNFKCCTDAVSYTHLTLPTMLWV